MDLKTRMFFWPVVLLGLLGLAFAGVADRAPSKPWVLLNSNHFEDAIGGQLYATEFNDSYAFTLTPSQADYLVAFVKPSVDPVWYFESGSPVSPTMAQSLAALGKPNIYIARNPSPAAWFADRSPAPFAALVGSSDGAEALSVAPLVAVQNGGLYFADPSSIDALLAGLKAKNRTVLVYGSIASSARAASLSGVSVINTGSKYADNLQALSRYMALRPTKQVFILSGRTFEKSMIDPTTPVVLAGRTEVSPDLISYLRTSGVTTAQVFAGDADIQGAVASIKSETGIVVFSKFGEGYTGNAAVQPLTVMALPGPNVVLSVDNVHYRQADHTYWMAVENQGNVPAWVRVSTTLPNGVSGSSKSVMVPRGAHAQVSVNLNADAYVSGGQIPQTTFQVSSGSQPALMESVDVLNVSAIPVIASAPAAAPSGAPAPAVSGAAPPPPASNPLGQNLLVGIAVVALVIGGGYWFMSARPKGKGKAKK